MSYIYAYISTLPVLVVLDLTWVGFLMAAFYKSRLPMLTSTIAWQPAVIWYLLYLFGIFFFAVSPAKTVSSAALSGAVLGLIAYGTYDLINMATLAPWPISVTIVDMLWRAVLGAVVSAAGFCILGFLSSRVFIRT